MAATNWSKSAILYHKNQLKPVKTEQELSEIMRSTTQKVKARGSGMSYLSIAALDNSDDIMLDLSLLDGLVEESDSIYTFYSSTLISTVTEILIKNKRQMITCPGVLLTQTLAGAISTGTHGQDCKNGGIYDSVDSLTAVLADGSIKHFQRNDYGFDAWRLSLGSLGIITRVSLKTEPLAVYRLTKGLTKYDDLQTNFIAWNEASEHAKAWWFPETDDVQVWRTFKATKEEEDTYHQNGDDLYKIPEGSTKCTTDNFSKTIDGLVETMDNDTKDVDITQGVDQVLNRHNARFDTVLRFRSLEHCLGNMYQLWCKGIPAPQVNCEIAVPLEKLSPALAKLKSYLQESGEKLHYPFILRATGSSKAWLSPAYNRPVVYIGFLVYLSESYKGDQDRLKMLYNIEQVLAEFDAIPHYGKFYTKKLYKFEKTLERFDWYLL
jgi:FAD/FMN-containing dehydrogenase